MAILKNPPPLRIATKNKGGRPTKFHTIDKVQLKKLILKGFKDSEICDFFKINHDTLTEWKKKYPEFSAAIKDWKIEADAKVERSLYERALGYSHKAVKIFQHEGMIVKEEYREHYPPDPTSCIFWLKNRKPAEWRDKQEIEGNLNFTAESLLRIFEEAKKKANNRLLHV